MGASFGGKGGLMAEINVTPFVDVMLVLLIIFMVTAPMMTEGMDIDLPKARATETLTLDDGVLLTLARDGSMRLDELPGVDERIVAALSGAGIEMIEDFLARAEEELLAIEGMSAEDLESVRRIIEENVEVIEEEFVEEPEPMAETEIEESGAAETETEVYECPDCHAVVTPEMTQCPQCGVALSFEYEDEGAEDQES